MKRFAIVCGVGLFLSCQGGAQKAMAPKDLWVISSPTGQVNGPLRVEVVFSQPMVAAEKIGATDSPPLTIKPAVKGKAQWTDDRTLVFVADEILPPATQFTASVPSGVTALDGHRLVDDHTFEFSTARLAGTASVDGSKRLAKLDQRIFLRFNQRVEFNEVAKNCNYTHQTETRSVKRAADDELGAGKTIIVVPTAPLTSDTSWEFSCAAALTGDQGDLGLAEAISTKFKTYGKARFLSTDLSGDKIAPEQDSYKIAFSTPLKDPYKLTISPAVRGFPERCYSMGENPPGISCSLELEPQTAYTVDVAADQKDIFGQTIEAAKTLAFKTTDAQPGVAFESGYFVAELKRPVLPVWARNAATLEVTAVEVTRKNFAQVRRQIDWWETKEADFKEARGKGIKRRSTRINTGGHKNKWKQFAVDPSTLFRGKKPGPGMYYLEIGAPDVDEYPFNDDGKKKVLVNFTDIGVVSKISPSAGLVWVTRLSTGKPLPGATVTVQTRTGKVTWKGRTGSDGIAKLPPLSKLKPRSSSDVDENEGWNPSALNIFVSHKRDFTMVNARSSGGLAAWNFNVSQDTSGTAARLRGFMHTDRGLYRPGETVHVKGLARESRLGSKLTRPKTKKVDVEVFGPRGKSVHTVSSKMSSYGGFWFDLALPGDARLGDYTVRAKLPTGTFSRRFAVEEFRPSTFEVTGKASAKRIVHRGRIDASIEAKYFYGAPVRKGTADITVYQRPRVVRFKNHPGFNFYDERTDDRYHDASSYSQELVTEDTVSLDNDGRASISVKVGPADMTKDADLIVNAQVSSQSNEVINKSFTIPYFRSKRYFGIKSPGYFLETGKRHKFELIAVDPAGASVAAPAKVTVVRRDWNCVWEDWGYRGSYKCRDIENTIVSKTMQLSSGRATPIEFTAKGGGEYWVKVEPTSKDAGRAAAMQLYAWGSDGGSYRSDDGMTFDIIADKKEYRAGEKAQLIFKTDMAKAKALITIERDGVIERQFMNVTAKNKHIAIPIKANHAPNVYVSVALVQGRMGKGRRGKPRMKMGMINLPVRPEDNVLNVSVETEEKDYRPGANVTAKVKVTDSRGRPVAAEVALTAADEGVLSLIAYKTPNPIPTFYAPWGLGVATASQFAFIRDIPGPGAQRPATGGDTAGPGTVRSRFMSTAVWKPGIVTNSRGIAVTTFKAPDNLTAFRVMAIAADKSYRFGSGDMRFTVSKPLQLHRYLPRFLTSGDVLEGGVVLHNETKRAGTAKVTIGTSLLSVTGPKTRTVEIPAGGRAPVLWTLSAASAGDAELSFSVVMNGERDAVRFDLPVHHPSPELRKFVKSGETTAGETVTIDLPTNAIPSSAMVHVSVDPNGLAGIEEGLRDLIGYPYGCLEQTTSRVVPMIAVRGLVESLNLKGLSTSDIDRYVTAGIAKIGRHQTAYGGFSLWPGGEPERYYTAYALWGLHLAKKAGYKVDESRITEAIRYLKTPVKAKTNDYHSATGELGSQAFSLYVRSELGDKDTAAATKLLAQSDKLPIYGKAFLARALAAGLGPKDKAVVKLVGELAAIADDATLKKELIVEPKNRELGYYMSGSMRTTSIVLNALALLDPKSPALGPLAKTIMRHRRGNYYQTTQGNLYGLLALDAYARASAQSNPSVQVALGQTKLLDAKLSGTGQLRLASAKLPSGGETLTITPKGKIHYNIEVRYREKASELKARSNGLTVKREYLDEDGKPKTSFKVGDVVRVRLSMTGVRRKSHLMLSDRLPAGFEALNARFKTTGAAGGSKTSGRRYWGGTREIRDERVDFATEYNWSSNYEREYQMRAIAVGKFAVPPTVSELMYEPEKNARTALGTITIKGK